MGCTENLPYNKSTSVKVKKVGSEQVLSVGQNTQIIKPACFACLAASALKNKREHVCTIPCTPSVHHTTETTDPSLVV